MEKVLSSRPEQNVCIPVGPLYAFFQIESKFNALSKKGGFEQSGCVLIAAPFVSAEVLYDARPDRIQNHISAKLQQVAVLIHKD
jgi:hypothetical protein